VSLSRKSELKSDKLLKSGSQEKRTMRISTTNCLIPYTISTD
jgi:hypothetical protein